MAAARLRTGAPRLGGGVTGTAACATELGGRGAVRGECRTPRAATFEMRRRGAGGRRRWPHSAPPPPYCCPYPCPYCTLAHGQRRDAAGRYVWLAVRREVGDGKAPHAVHARRHLRGLHRLEHLGQPRRPPARAGTIADSGNVVASLCAPPPLFPPVLTGQASSLPSYLLDTIDPWERRGVAHLRVMSCERTAMARYAMPASRTFFGKDACNTLDRSEPSRGARDSSRRGPNAAVQHAGVSRRGRGGDLRRRQVPVHRDENLRTNQPSERDTTHRNRQTHRRGRRAWQGAAGAARAAAARRGVRAPGPLRPR